MPNKDLIKARKQFVGQRRAKKNASGFESAAGTALGQPSKRGNGDAASRKAFFIKTRVQELKAAGKKVDRKKLAARYESGKVKREEFYAGGAKEKVSRIAAAKPKPTSSSVSAVDKMRGRSTNAAQRPMSVTDIKSAAGMALGQMQSASKTAAKKPIAKPAAKKPTASTTTTTVAKKPVKKSTPKPTAAPKPTVAPKPTMAPKPTVAPKPTAAPKPKPSAKPKKK